MTGQQFCTQCGAKTESRIPDDDNRMRAVCTGCHFVHYENPKIIVGCLLEWQGKVLLCKRSIEPRNGYWTLPAGFMENQETMLDGALREVREEACAECDDLRLFAVYNSPKVNQVYVMFQGELRDGIAQVGAESLEVKLFGQEDIPWDELAFPVVTEALTRHFEQRYLGNCPVHYADIFSRPGEPLDITHRSM